MTNDWKTLAEAKKKSVDELIPQEWRIPTEIKSKYNETVGTSVLGLHETFGILNEKEIAITKNYKVKELLSKIASKELSSVEVATAFSKRAAISTQLTNCCTELLFKEAIERAKWLDDYLEENGQVFGPLHGLPISVKDSHFIKGVDSTVGYVSFIGNKTNITDDAAVVKVLRDLGAVIHVKTNVPTTMMTGDSENNIFGRTLNPNNLKLTAGGSSGGEASLVKQRGSLIGIGTDIAGSIRIPSLSCGVYGIRPTAHRFPFEGNQSPTRENALCPISVVSGPIAHDLEDLNFVLDLILNHSNASKYCHDMLPIPWNSKIELPSTIKVGVVLECDSVPIQPPLKRIIKEAVSKLDKNSNFEIIYLKGFPSYKEGWATAFKLFISDPKDESIANIFKSGEPMINSLSKGGMEVYGPPPQIPDELFELVSKKNEIKNKWIDLFNEHDLDVILAPGAPHTASPHDDFGIAPYTTVWNLVDFPAMVIPFGAVDKEIDQYDDVKIDYCPCTAPSYDKEVYHGGPGHVQLICRTLQDEKLLKIAELTDKVLNKAI